MRESGHDMNHLLYLHQVALMEADAAPSEVSRSMHLRIARAYEGEISRRTGGRMPFGCKTLMRPIDKTPADEPRILVQA